jgi:hypothetical protein
VAVSRARLGPAGRWAPAELETAAATLAEAEVEYAREAARFWPLRDFDGVATRLWSAETAARAAEQAAEQRRSAARAKAERAVEDVVGLLDVATALTAKTTLAREDRVRLARARLLASEARALIDHQEYLGALESAEGARGALSRALGAALESARRYASADRVATWRRWVEETREWSRATGKVAIIVVKEKSRLELLKRGRTIRTYAADVGSNGLGRKLEAGDLATPEGIYRVVAKKGRGRSSYYKALLLDYPNAVDRQRIAAARSRGEVSPGSSPGRFIEIHGEGGRGVNWTDGCVAVSNEHMDEIFAAAEIETRVTIVGGDGTDGAFSGFVRRLAADGREQ